MKITVLLLTLLMMCEAQFSGNHESQQITHSTYSHQSKHLRELISSHLNHRSYDESLKNIKYSYATAVIVMTATEEEKK